MSAYVSKTLQDAIDKHYPEGPTELEYLRFYANLAVRSLYYADAQGVLNADVIDHLARQSFQAEQKFAAEDEEQENAVD